MKPEPLKPNLGLYRLPSFQLRNNHFNKSQYMRIVQFEGNISSGLFHPPPMDLKNGIAVVTGAARGIGRAVARSLLKRGAKVVIADLRETEGRATKDELAKEFGSNVQFIVCDVSQLDQFEDALNLAKSSFGGLNILVNNAGIADDSGIDSFKMISVNCASVVTGTRLAMKHMSKKNGGSGGAVVNVSSTTALYDPWPSVAVYCSSKAFVQRFSVCMGDSLYYEPSGVRVMSVCPGLTVTNMGDGLTDLYDLERQESLNKELMENPSQNTESVGEGVAKILERATSGTTWLIEEDKPPQRVHMKVVKDDDFLI